MPRRSDIVQYDSRKTQIRPRSLKPERAQHRRPSLLACVHDKHNGESKRLAYGSGAAFAGHAGSVEHAHGPLDNQQFGFCAAEFMQRHRMKQHVVHCPSVQIYGWAAARSFVELRIDVVRPAFCAPNADSVVFQCAQNCQRYGRLSRRGCARRNDDSGLHIFDLFATDHLRAAMAEDQAILAIRLATGQSS